MGKKKKGLIYFGDREWFDQDYSAKTVYKRLWGYAKRYKALIFTGMLLGMVTGGAWFPIFQLISPFLQQSQLEQVVAVPEETKTAEQAPAAQTVETKAKPKNEFEKQEQKALAQAEKYQQQLDRAAKIFAKFGIQILNEDGSPRASWSVILILLFVTIFALQKVAQFLNQYLLSKAGMKVVLDVKNDMFKHLQDQSLNFFGRSDVGKLMSRVTGDPGTIQSLISSTMGDMCRAPFEVLAGIAFVVYFAVRNNMISLLLLAVLGYPLCILPIVWLGKVIRRWTTRLLEQGANVGSNFHENLTCIRVVKAYNTEDSEVDKFNGFNLRAYKMCMRALRWGMLVGPMTEVVAIFLAAGFIAVCFAQGKTLVDIFPLLPPFIVLYKPMKQIGRIQTALENGRAALNRIFSLLDVDDALVEKPDALPIAEFKNEIEFDHVSFKYTPEGDTIVDDSSFTIKRGEMYAVVGSTGSGKSTLANLLARFYDVSAGSVRMDGHDVRDYKIADLRKIVGAITQEALLFNDTIAANIAYGSPNATQEQIEAAAKLANAHDFIVAHSDGYKRIVGEKGFVLSGGERQRVAIARAILRNPPVLILDEATSALDTVTEQAVQQAINNLMQNRTTFAIAHRLSTIQRANCILVIDHGRIVERGTHQELYDKGGVYRHLCDIQNHSDQGA